MQKGTTVTHPRILVIKDRHCVDRSLHEALEGAGYRVLSAPMTLDPVDLSQLRPALVVLDLSFDGETRGVHFLQSLQATPGARGIPVMICVPDARMAQGETGGIRNLAADVLLKPFDRDDFVARVAAACHASRLRPRPPELVLNDVPISPDWHPELPFDALARSAPL
jgi:DNA-binding response OmpR family regulator